MTEMMSKSIFNWNYFRFLFNRITSEHFISIEVIDDDVFEEDESFFIRLSNPTNGAVLGAASLATVMVGTYIASIYTFHCCAVVCLWLLWVRVYASNKHCRFSMMIMLGSFHLPKVNMNWLKRLACTNWKWCEHLAHVASSLCPFTPKTFPPSKANHTNANHIN